MQEQYRKYGKNGDEQFCNAWDTDALRTCIAVRISNLIQSCYHIPQHIWLATMFAAKVAAVLLELVDEESDEAGWSLDEALLLHEVALLLWVVRVSLRYGCFWLLLLNVFVLLGLEAAQVADPVLEDGQPPIEGAPVLSDIVAHYKTNIPVNVKNIMRLTFLKYNWKSFKKAYRLSVMCLSRSWKQMISFLYYSWQSKVAYYWPSFSNNYLAS